MIDDDMTEATASPPPSGGLVPPAEAVPPGGPRPSPSPARGQFRADPPRVGGVAREGHAGASQQGSFPPGQGGFPASPTFGGAGGQFRVPRAAAEGPGQDWHRSAGQQGGPAGGQFRVPRSAVEGAGPGRLEQPAEQGAPAGGQFRVEEDEPRYRYDPSTGTLSSGLEAPKHGRDDLFGDMYASAGNGLPSPLDPGRRAVGERPVVAPGPPKRGVFDRLFGRRR